MLPVQEIKTYKLFEGLSEEELATIAPMCNRRTYESNTIIFNPETRSENILIVEDPNEAIQIEITINNQDRMVIHTLSKGETFGWGALGTQHVRTATARSVERVSVISINGKSLMQILEKNNHTGFIVMRNLVDIASTRLAYTTVAFRHVIRKSKNRVKAAVAL